MMPDANDKLARLALWSIPVAVLVMGIKFLAWWLTGSVALLSDALESIVNVVAAVVALSAIRYARRPPDAEHPFGHHKAEYFAAVVEGALIMLAAFVIIREAVPVLINPKPIDAPWLGLWVNGFAAVINGAWAAVLIRAGREHRSAALAADGRHIMADVVTSVGVIVGLVLAVVTGWAVLDPLLALVVAVNVLLAGARVIRESVDALMDVTVDAEEAGRIEAAILGAATGAIEVHDIRTRRAGPQLFVEFHLVVDAAMSVRDSHEICDRIEGAIEGQAPGAQVSIHVEPGFKAKPDEGLAVER